MASGHHRFETFVRAAPERVFAAITDPEATRRHQHGSGFPGTAFDEPPAQGAPFHVTAPDGSTAASGTVVRSEPPRRLAHTWHAAYDESLATEPDSLVEWRVDDAGAGLSRVVLVHTQLAQSPRTWAAVEHAWPWFLASTKSLVESGRALPPVTGIDTAETTSDPVGEWHRLQAVEANNSTWELIERTGRDAEDDEEMLRRAYASTYHWTRAARRGPANTARGDWLLSRVHLLLGRPELALHHAERCLATCRGHGLEDFDLAYGHEARGRALLALGRDPEAAREWELARAVPVSDPEDRAALAADLAAVDAQDTPDSPGAPAQD